MCNYKFVRHGVNKNVVGIQIETGEVLLTKNQLMDSELNEKEEILKQWEIEKQKANQEIIDKYNMLPGNQKKYFGDEG